MLGRWPYIENIQESKEWLCSDPRHSGLVCCPDVCEHRMGVLDVLCGDLCVPVWKCVCTCHAAGENIWQLGLCFPPERCLHKPLRQRRALLPAAKVLNIAERNQNVAHSGGEGDHSMLLNNFVSPAFPSAL